MNTLTLTENVIPDIVHPMGKFWNQPNKSNIIIDDKHAVMTGITFSQLKDYSQSIPSGVYDGKMWRQTARDGIHYLRWYSPSSEANNCNINTRIILLIEN